MKKALILCMTALVMIGTITAQPLTIDLKKVYEIGSGDLILGDVPNLARDKQGNLFVPDSKAYKIYKFSPEGKLLLSFGQKGEGPGDFKRLCSVVISENNELMVGGQNTLSVFDTAGKLKKKYNLSRLGYIFNITYAGGHHVLYREIMKRNSPVPLNLARVSPELNVIEKPFLKDGDDPVVHECMMSNKIYTSHFYYTYSASAGCAAAALSKKYLIKIIDERGKVVHRITRDLEKPEIGKKERNYLVETDIMLSKTFRHLPKSVRSDLKGLIPGHKCFIRGLTLSGKYVFVGRIKEDITDPKAPVPVDLFTLKGKFLGQIKMRSFPESVTEKHMYFIERNEADDLLVTKYEYRLTQ